MCDLQDASSGQGSALRALREYECLLIALREAMLDSFDQLNLLAGVVESLERLTTSPSMCVSPS